MMKRMLNMMVGTCLAATVGLECTGHHGAAIALLYVAVGLTALLIACEARR